MRPSMTRRVPFDLLPKTPGGRHLKRDEIFADEVEIDDDITIKSSLFCECVPGNPWFEGEDNADENTKPSKYVARKSVDLRRIRSVKDRIEAICSSPMVDARPRRRYSFAEGMKNPREGDSSPLRLPNPKDLLHRTCRRLSRLILSRSNMLLSPRDELLGIGQSNITVESRSPKVLDDIPLENENVTTPFSKQSASVAMASSSTTSTLLSPDYKTSRVVTNTPVSDDTVYQHPDSLSHFRLLAEMESTRLNRLCDDWNSVMVEESQQIPEQALDAIRATVCKCRLVLQKKIPFFLSLVDMAVQGDTVSASSDAGSKENQAPKADANDLAGYWALVTDEIVRADAAFDRLRMWRDEAQWQPSLRPITPARNPIKTATNRQPKKALRSLNKISTRRIEDPNMIPPETAKSVAKALRSSPKKSKASVRSKLSEFLKSKRREIQGISSIEIVGIPEIQKKGTADQGESFAIPQQVSTSALRRSSRSAAKRPALESLQSVKLNASVDDQPSVEQKAQTHVASTPIAAVRHSGDLQFGSTLCTPISIAAGMQVSSPSKVSLSALRPGTPRPPTRTTTSSSKKRIRTPLR